MTLDRSELRSRYQIEGRLVLDTALHIGTGRQVSAGTDSPVLRDGMNRPLIPGSSFKGAFRAAVERLLPNLPNFRTCQLAEGYEKCLSTNRDLSKAYGVLSEAAGRRARLTAQEQRQALQQLGREDLIGKEIGENHLLEVLEVHLCDTCKTFGSVHLGAVTYFHDLPVCEPWLETTQVRDGVGIDRDSERAVDQLKFDYEVVPALTAFEFCLTLENPSTKDVGLAVIGLQEFIHGMTPLGGIRSRGLGRCHLEQVTVKQVDFSNSSQMRDYLLKGWPEGQAWDESFAAQHIQALLSA